MANGYGSVFNQPPRLIDRLFGWFIRWWEERMLRKALPKAIIKKEESEQRKKGGFWNTIVSFVKKIFNWIKRKILNGILNFFDNILSFFIGGYLKRGRDIPFVADANSDIMREAFGSGSTKNVGIFQGVFNDETNEITKCEYIEADNMDNQARNLISDKSLVVLT